MSTDGSIEQTFADDEYRFRLGFKELIMLQEARNCGPLELMNRLQAGAWRVEDIRETIRIGLIGGGTEPKKALRLVRDYVEARPFMENLALAMIVISAALAGPPDEPLGESSTPSVEATTVKREPASTISQTANSDGANSTDSESPSDLAPIRSTDVHGSSFGRPQPDGSRPIAPTTTN